MTDSTNPILPFARTARRLARHAMACALIGRKLASDNRAAVALEYGLIVALVVIATMFAIADLGRSNLEMWSNVSTKMSAAVG